MVDLSQSQLPAAGSCSELTFAGFCPFFSVLVCQNLQCGEQFYTRHCKVQRSFKAAMVFALLIRLFFPSYELFVVVLFCTKEGYSVEALLVRKAARRASAVEAHYDSRPRGSRSSSCREYSSMLVLQCIKACTTAMPKVAHLRGVSGFLDKAHLPQGPKQPGMVSLPVGIFVACC